MAPRRYELNDQQYELIKSVLSKPVTSTRGRPRRDDRTILNGIFWVLCSGAAWRDVPERYGPWKTVYDRYRGWENDGTIDRILERLHLKLDEAGLIDPDTWFADSTTVRATRAASGAAKKNREDPALGRSRGGLSTKIHVLCDRRGIPLSAHLSAGQCHDAPQFVPLWQERFYPGKPIRMIADKGYDSQHVRGLLSQENVDSVIPRRKAPSMLKAPELKPDEKERYKERNVIERLIGHLKECRRIATRFEKKASRFLAMVKLAFIRRILKTYFSDTA